MQTVKRVVQRLYPLKIPGSIHSANIGCSSVIGEFSGYIKETLDPFSISNSAAKTSRPSAISLRSIDFAKPR